MAKRRRRQATRWFQPGRWRAPLVAATIVTGAALWMMAVLEFVRLNP